jgi:hypothetical protein
MKHILYPHTLFQRQTIFNINKGEVVPELLHRACVYVLTCLEHEVNCWCLLHAITCVVSVVLVLFTVGIKQLG